MKESKLLLQALLLRIIFTLGILYCFKMPMFLKIVVIMWFIDRIDMNLLKQKTGRSSTTLGRTWSYQKLDKIGDSMCYVILLFYIVHNKLLSKSDTVLLVGLLIFRLIGVSLFLQFHNRKYLFYFPNFFIDVSLGLFIIQYFSLVKYKIVILVVIFIYKLIQEYLMHFRSNQFPNEEEEEKILTGKPIKKRVDLVQNMVKL